MKNCLLERLDRLFLMVTNNCNARCLLCQYWKSKSKGFLPLKVIEEKVVPLINKYVEPLFFHMVLLFLFPVLGFHEQPFEKIDTLKYFTHF
jgi:MoaA/NifB/PqqE/SkfB family radical SAM enzyme